MSSSSSSFRPEKASENPRGLHAVYHAPPKSIEEGEDEADEEAIEVSDFIVSIPEIEAYGGLDGISLLNSSSAAGRAGPAMVVEDLETERPILKLGPCVFIGQHQVSLGTTVVFDTSPGAGLRAAQKAIEEQKSKAAAALIASTAAVEVPPIVSIARRTIVFRLATGSPGIKELFKKEG